MNILLLTISVLMLGGCNGYIRQASLIYSIANQYDTSVNYPDTIELWEPGVTAQNEMVIIDEAGGQIYKWHKIDPSKKEPQLVDYNYRYTGADGIPAPVERTYVEFGSKEWCEAVWYLIGVTHISVK